jgi:hypothetical protein
VRRERRHLEVLLDIYREMMGGHAARAVQRLCPLASPARAALAGSTP